MRRSVRVVMATAVVGGLLVPAAAATEAAAPTGSPPASGVALPIRPQRADYGTATHFVSPDYVGWRRETYRQYETPRVDLHRTTDGSVVRSLEYWGEPRQSDVLSGTSVVRRVPSPVEGTRVEVSDVETGAMQWTVDVPAAETIFSTGASWVLSLLPAPDEGNLAILRRPGRPVLAVEGMRLGVPGSDGPYAVGDSTGLVVHTGGTQTWALDLDSGRATLLDTARLTTRAFATPHRFFVVEEGYSVMPDSVRWWERDGSGSGSVQVEPVPDSRSYVAFGDRLASLRADTAFESRVEPLDLATGARETAVLTRALEVRSLGDGRIFAHLADTENGRMVIAGDGVPTRTLADLPEIGRPVDVLTLADGRLHTGFVDQSPSPPAETWSQPVDGSAPPAPLSVGGEPVEGGLIDARGGTLLTLVPAAHGHPALRRLSWAGGHRDVTTTDSLVLSGGGQVLQRTADGAPTTRFEDARTGASFGSVTNTTWFWVDGTMLWSAPDASGVVRARDLTGVTPDRSVVTGLRSRCVDGIQVVDRFALLRCGSSSTVVELTGRQAPLIVPAGSASVYLGAGFVCWLTYVTDQDVTRAFVEVRDLGGTGEQRRYGPVATGSGVAADADTARLVYLDDQRLPRRVDLGWIIGDELPPATTPGVPTGVSATAGDGQAEVTWTAPVVSGGSAVTGYTVTASPGGRTASTAGATTATVTGLTNGTRYTFSIAARNAVGSGSGSTPSGPVTPKLARSGSGFVAVSPKRVLDTRSGIGAPRAKVGAGRSVTVALPGLPAGTTAVTLNVTATKPSSASYVSVYPGGTTRPGASNLNVAAGQTVANLVTVAVGPGNKVTLYNNAGSIDLVADLAGYYAPDLGSGFVAVSPKRVLDTRSGIGAPRAKVGAGRSVTVALPGLPAGTTAVTLNVTATKPSSASYVSVYPGGTTRPGASNLNVAAGQTVANLVTVAVGPGNKVTLYNNAGSIDLVADLAGYYAPDLGSGFVAVSPKRVLDTRSGIGAPRAKVGAGRSVTVALPGLPAGTTAVTLNVTATKPSSASYVSVYPGGTTRPGASNLNVAAGQTVANLVTVAVGPGNKVTLYNNAGSIDLVADLAGYHIR